MQSAEISKPVLHRISIIASAISAADGPLSGISFVSGAGGFIITALCGDIEPFQIVAHRCLFRRAAGEYRGRSQAVISKSKVTWSNVIAIRYNTCSMLYLYIASVAVS